MCSQVCCSCRRKNDTALWESYKLAARPAIPKPTCIGAVNKDLLPMTEQVGSASLQHQAVYWPGKPKSSFTGKNQPKSGGFIASCFTITVTGKTNDLINSEKITCESQLEPNHLNISPLWGSATFLYYITNVVFLSVSLNSKYCIILQLSLYFFPSLKLNEIINSS